MSRLVPSVVAVFVAPGRRITSKPSGNITSTARCSLSHDACRPLGVSGYSIFDHERSAPKISLAASMLMPMAWRLRSNSTTMAL